MTLNKIDKLTPDQERQMIAFREEWRAIGTATGKADIEAIRPVINDFYWSIDKASPYIWRCESPFTAQLVMAFLKSNKINLYANLRDNLRANLYANLYDNLSDNLRDNLYANLYANLRDNLYDNLRDNLRDNVEYIPAYLWGSLDAFWIVFYRFPMECLKPDIYPDDDVKILNGWSTIAKNAFWLYPFENIVFVCDRPSELHFDNQYRMHSENSPACAFSDDWQLFYWHGVEVPENVIMHPETITAQQIKDERNAEVRRVMLEKFGEGRYIEEGGFKAVHEDSFGRLYVESLPDDEDLVIVRVLNSTPEHDGSIKPYWLRVDPNAYNGKAGEIAQAAVASTWRWPGGGYVFKNWRDYRPIQET